MNITYYSYIFIAVLLLLLLAIYKKKMTPLNLVGITIMIAHIILTVHITGYNELMYKIHPKYGYLLPIFVGVVVSIIGIIRAIVIRNNIDPPTEEEIDYSDPYHHLIK